MRLPKPDSNGLYPTSFRLKKRTFTKLIKIAKKLEISRVAVVRKIIDDKYEEITKKGA